MFEAKLKEILSQVEDTLKNESPDNKLPGNTFYLDNGNILCCQRENGVSRFPYRDGDFTLWAHSDGSFFADESVLTVFKHDFMDNDSPINFFVGIPREDGTYFPISILGGSKQLFEPYNVKRYLVYERAAAYYIADTDLATFAVRVSVPASRQMSFSFTSINKTDKPLKYCLTTYFEALLRKGFSDYSFWTKDNRNSRYIGNGRFILSRKEDPDYYAMLIERDIKGATLGENYHTASRPEFLVYNNCNIGNAESLKLGKFKKQSVSSKYVTPIAAEILHLTSDKNSYVDFLFTITADPNIDLSSKSFLYTPEELNNIIEKKAADEELRLSNTKLSFGDWHNDKINVNILNKFIKNLQKQVDFCAMGKNYAGIMLGVRDVFQQLEQGIIWSPDMARSRMIRALSFIHPNGRPPRQIAFPEVHGQTLSMDLRPFIDQGNWIITTFYMYLAYTDDYSILNEECGYYEIVDASKSLVKPSSLKDSVLEHLVRIADYLISNLDREAGTNCLRIVHGDWNDAIDGIGKTKDEGKTYGTGVSVMASLQLYRNLAEIAEILKKNGNKEKADYYLGIREELAKGLKKYAVETNDKGEVRLIHGWGDHISYKIGSFCDSDGVSRISFAPFAYWAISDLVSATPEYKQVIIDNIHALDSVYGILTNYPKFTPETEGVGRIAGIVAGFSENECAYVHASMFSVMALFLTGDSEYAWKQIEKSIIITHDNCTKSPFVMPNSYCRNLDYCVDGLSQADWFTGSGSVLYKNLFRFCFGIEPNLEGLTIQTAAYMPTNSATAEFVIKGKKITLNYKKEGKNEREILLDGKKVDAKFDPMMQTKKLFIPTSELKDGMVISVID